MMLRHDSEISVSIPDVSVHSQKPSSIRNCICSCISPLEQDYYSELDPLPYWTRSVSSMDLFYYWNDMGHGRYRPRGTSAIRPFTLEIFELRLRTKNVHILLSGRNKRDPVADNMNIWGVDMFSQTAVLSELLEVSSNGVYVNHSISANQNFLKANFTKQSISRFVIGPTRQNRAKVG